MTGTVVCFGELLLRMGPPGHQRLETAQTLEVQVGGAEANVASAMAQLGYSAQMVSVVPDSALGEKAVSTMRSRGVDCQNVSRAPGRLGLYFLETGAVQRPSTIHYDRTFSAFSQTEPDQYSWPQILDGATFLHLSGITPAVSANCAEAAWDAVVEAKRRDVKVSFDGNYRRALWENWSGDGPQFLHRLIEHSNIAFINEKDLGLIFRKNFGSRREAVSHAFEAFPALDIIAATRRSQISVTTQTLQGELYRRDGVWASEQQELIGVVDRIGGGDAFSAGVLSGVLDGIDAQRIIDFGTAASVFKHSIPGDALVGAKNEILQLMESQSLDVKR